MDENNIETVSCCFCGQSLPYVDAVQMTVSVKEMDDDEKQGLFAHKKCLACVLHPSVPLHPDLL